VLLACLLACSATVAIADSRVFTIANQPDGYGVDQCLANSEKCGSHAALAFCQSKEFARATAYRKVTPGEITASVSSGASCSHAGCSEDYVAITCER
jgi:hypothetical protein